MLGIRLGRHDPGHVRQPIRENVIAEDVEQRSALQNVGPGSRFLREWTAVWSVLILMEVQQ